MCRALSLVRSHLIVLTDDEDEARGFMLQTTVDLFPCTSYMHLL